ncbi:MAG: L-2-amino-thiazoline-4-carboxylic acid hydrolase, partial [Lachnospiraceae bacterium]|nr:L-2-amino-thiazoline-4-carboxylic acid hydrolase [Lachnospiraceae bacterium]
SSENCSPSCSARRSTDILQRPFRDLTSVGGMKDTAALRAADRNPYSWNMEYLLYPDGSGYEARFTTCGICTLMKELGLVELVPAMCRLDYTMSEAGGASEFVREYTLASGGPYCDCGYKKKGLSHEISH